MKRLTFKGWVHHKLGEIRRAKWIQASPTGQETARGRGLLRLKTRLRQEITRAARAIFFPLYHTGATPPQPDVKPARFRSRVREVLTRTARAVFFPLYHTGAEARGTPQLKLLRTRLRRSVTRLARARFFPLAHFTAPAPEANINVIGFATRLRQSFSRARVLAKRTWQVFAPPPIAPDININVIQFFSRSRAVYAHTGRRQTVFMNEFMHFEPPAPPAVLRSWTACWLSAHTARGGR